MVWSYVNVRADRVRCWMCDNAHQLSAQWIQPQDSAPTEALAVVPDPRHALPRSHARLAAHQAVQPAHLLAVWRRSGRTTSTDAVRAPAAAIGAALTFVGAAVAPTEPQPGHGASRSLRIDARGRWEHPPALARRPGGLRHPTAAARSPHCSRCCPPYRGRVPTPVAAGSAHTTPHCPSSGTAATMRARSRCSR